MSDPLSFIVRSKSYLLQAESLSSCRLCNIAPQSHVLLRNVYVGPDVKYAVKVEIVNLSSLTQF